LTISQALRETLFIQGQIRSLLESDFELYKKKSSYYCERDETVERGRAKGLGGKIEEGEGGKLGRVEEIEEEAFEGPGIGEEEGEGVGVNLGGESVEKSLKRDYLRK
ncbi:523_t:CDS:2, partial [Funneliformis geosporum]